MGNAKEKIQENKMIEYPLKDIEKFIDSKNKICSNKHMANHDNINIIFNQESNDIPSLYRCPVCLCIPLAIYQEPRIFYKCNCGEYNCSIDYFLSNFISYPISEINFKDSSSEQNFMVFCSDCSKFIDVNKHKKEYFKHSFKDLNNIIINKSNEAKYDEFIIINKSNAKYDEFRYKVNKGFEFMNVCSDSKEIEDFVNKIQYNDFINKFLKYNIIQLIENKYNEFEKRAKEKNKADYIEQIIFICQIYLL